MNELRKVKRALISLSDKTGAAEFARALASLGVQIISTGGTAKMLREHGLQVTEVADLTGFPEMMDGRVKTLHPKIHGAFLALRDNPDHIAAMAAHGIEPIDMVVINLYPFEETVAKTGVGLEEAVENIDIGGPAMIRSASKNWRDVAVLTDSRLYDEVIEEMKASDCSLSVETRQRLATLAFTRTAAYDLAISSYLAKQLSNDELDRLEPFNPLGDLVFFTPEEDDPENDEESIDNDPESKFQSIIELTLKKHADLRYGENPHQKAALYLTGETVGIANAKQLHGKEMSFNNYVDAEAAWNLVNDIDDLAAAIIKHTNPSGVGIGATSEEAYRRALSTDPISAFGGIVAFNREVDIGAAAAVNEVFTEVVVAPGYTVDAIELFRTKKNLRVIRAKPGSSSGVEFEQISGGMLVQEKDGLRISIDEIKIVTEKQPTEMELRSMILAWRVCKHVKSNAIVIANNVQTIGVGAGQMNRVDSVRIAAMRSERFGLPLIGAALASDAFFPFRDNVDEAASIGISAIIQPGGSIKDKESIAAANEHGIVMAFTGIRHFKH
ncbi:MAG TPA: bifunctional phosphoribosylaminoimidazolecarboxamide formyltransferase/IMP cyclohydrolase [Pyrinomonadaceae bacterium]|nr:bifunctional phosphoribosylaminoimidazolecarboxamide formyltransferase/IMP cyclohydrolase [Chloracidobacterium sp.]HRJ88113.1 bifunctional phosphoribosylaminoimidazolecarboxamide formyltransferase/IMP cyclohydrolase [Pyrinomonadaceae bacterium]HRK50645.1 bifunctional phosphoribosylaminoimidazolecarboxamide formyltransferase/IMP cyclohydrolase [Pyrinomonadaceae bacterium]